MRIVKRKEFVKLPAGVPFAEYREDGQYPEEILIKGETLSHIDDYMVQPLYPYFEGRRMGYEQGEVLKDMFFGAKSPPLNYDCPRATDASTKISSI